MHVEAEVEAEAPAMVVVAQAYYHPWHAYVDGKSTPLWRANYAFQALEVAVGKHHVSTGLRGIRIAEKRGAIISLATLLFVGVGLFWYSKKGHQPIRNRCLPILLGFTFICARLSSDDCDSGQNCL